MVQRAVRVNPGTGYSGVNMRLENPQEAHRTACLVENFVFDVHHRYLRSPYLRELGDWTRLSKELHHGL